MRSPRKVYGVVARVRVGASGQPHLSGQALVPELPEPMSVGIDELGRNGCHPAPLDMRRTLRQSCITRRTSVTCNLVFDWLQRREKLKALLCSRCTDKRSTVILRHPTIPLSTDARTRRTLPEQDKPTRSRSVLRSRTDRQT